MYVPRGVTNHIVWTIAAKVAGNLATARPNVNEITEDSPEQRGCLITQSICNTYNFIIFAL